MGRKSGKSEQSNISRFGTFNVIMRLDQPYRQDVLYELMTFRRAGFVLGTLEPAYLRLCLSDFEIFETGINEKLTIIRG
jgi:hypothetical protein